jgi:hypothetical protein
MKTFEESGVSSADIDEIIVSVRRRVRPPSLRDFYVGLLLETRDKGDGPHTRQLIGGRTGRDAERCSTNKWVSVQQIQNGFEAGRAIISESLKGRFLDIELVPGGAHSYRIGIFDTAAGEVPFQVAGSTLRYRTSDIAPRLSFAGRMAHPGVGETREQYRKWLFLTPIFVMCGLFLACGLLLSFAMSIAFRAGSVPIAAIMSFGSVAALIWWSLRRWDRLFDDRLLLLGMADVAGDKRGVVLDREEVDGVRSIVLRHYIADCPICRAPTITLSRGEPDFRRRIVGRCDNSPREHVFSFDRVTLEGAPLGLHPAVARGGVLHSEPELGAEV